MIVMLAQLDNLLDEFRQLPVRPEHLPTLMEIAGCAHKENECSSILAFFLDSGNPHGLGTLFLHVISQIGGIQDHGLAPDVGPPGLRKSRCLDLKLGMPGLGL